MSYFISRTINNNIIALWRLYRYEKAISNNRNDDKASGVDSVAISVNCPSERIIDTIINLVSDTLKENNVSSSDIKFELFSTSSNEGETVASADGHTKISILVDDEETIFEMSQKQTLLEAALKQGLDVPYSCQGGICSSCICRITEGEAVLKKNQILTDEEIAEGLTLACQAHPTTATIKIDFDDV